MAKNMKCPISPLGDKVVILPHEEEEQMYGSIVIPDAGQERPEIGTILAIGPGRITNEGITIQSKLKVGQDVIVPKFGAQVVRIKNTSYIIASENDILGTIKIK
jgi:chaperonin GroES|tara:strand:+ start:83 stop:394 length:312 start_codon:yes stop_codon:yes gene_type:complete